MYFGLFAKLALCQKADKHLFPEFAKSTKIAGGREQGYKSKASNVWSKYYDKVTRLLKNIPGKYLYMRIQYYLLYVYLTKYIL